MHLPHPDRGLGRQMSSNVGDEDMSPPATQFPPERKVISSMSNCLWAYYILEKQRSFQGQMAVVLGDLGKLIDLYPMKSEKHLSSELDDEYRHQIYSDCS